ncbi:MAG TPA: EAL domain-containing protein, partial [Clostridiales bacterium]|nr:EAL domain-containing protein [Clostridiales bacterium]
FLQKMPKDTMIKLNKAYVQNIVTDRKKRSFLLSLMDIISTWDLEVIISGIETEEQKHLLDSRRCILQGYHFNMPKPLEQYLKELGQGA